MSFKVLAVGDTVGPPGLEYIQRRLRAIKRELEADFVVVNGENANVVGCTPRQADALIDAGADCVTLGNHTWTRWELQPYLDDSIRVIRPANYAPQCPGRGCVSLDTPAGEVLVVNLIGRFTLDPNTDNPFLTADDILGQTGTVERCVPPAKSWPWATSSTGALAPSGVRTRMCRPRTLASCRTHRLRHRSRHDRAR